MQRPSKKDEQAKNVYDLIWLALQKYGIALLLVLVILLAIALLLVHTQAEPGTPISLLGVISYTKAKPTGTPSGTQVKADIRIDRPRDDEKVPWSFIVEGTGVIPDGLDLWIFSTDNETHRYWPQDMVVPRSDNTWSGQVHGIGGYPGKKRTFGVFLVGRDGKVLLDLWKRAAENQKSIYLTDLTEDIRKIQEVGVVVESGRPTPVEKK
jgi:hypothetical protein